MKKLILANDAQKRRGNIAVVPTISLYTPPTRRVESRRRYERTRRQSWSSFTISCAVGDKWRHNDVIVKKVVNIDQNSGSQIAMFNFQIVDRIRRQSSLASCEFCSHCRCRRGSTRQLSRAGGVYWAWDFRSDHVSRACLGDDSDRYRWHPRNDDIELDADRRQNHNSVENV